MDWNSLLSFNLADGVACGVAIAAMAHTFTSERRRAHAADLARLTVERTWEPDDDVILLVFLYDPPDRHTRYELEARILRPKGAGLSKGISRTVRSATIGQLQIFSTRERLGLDPSAVPARKVRGPMSVSERVFRSGWVVSGAGTRVTIAATIIDQATTRRVVRKTFDISV